MCLLYVASADLVIGSTLCILAKCPVKEHLHVSVGKVLLCTVAVLFVGE
jgi:hypothetical protein